MSDPMWEFDNRPATAPPVRPRPVGASTSGVVGRAVGHPPAPPSAADPFAVPGRANASPWSASAPSRPSTSGSPGLPGPAVAGVPVGPPDRFDGSSPAPGPGRPPGARWGWRALTAFVAGGLLTAVGFGVGARVDDNETAAVAPSGTVVNSSTRDPIVVAPPDLDTTEPAAFVASILGPSVVQINTERGLGSGVIFDDGLIMTNNHVIELANTITVRLSDGRSLPAELLGTDPRTDIAVISVGTGHDLQPATLATDETLEVGQYTVAIGSPFDLQQTVTSGIVSAVNRPVYNGTGWNAMVQTDAAINPGNSGGALADREGRVIGINTAIQTDGLSNSNAGIGFAMPIGTANDIAQRIINGESLDPGFLGISAEEQGIDELGVVVTEVTAGSAAADAGIRLGDRVLSLDGAPVSAFQELAGLIQTSFPGDEVVLELIRDGQPLEVMVTLGAR